MWRNGTNTFISMTNYCILKQQIIQSHVPLHGLILLLLLSIFPLVQTVAARPLTNTKCVLLQSWPLFVRGLPAALELVLRHF